VHCLKNGSNFQFVVFISIISKGQKAKGKMEEGGKEDRKI